MPATIFTDFLAKWRIEIADINGETAVAVFAGSRLETVFIFSFHKDRITAIHAVRNPEKLAWIAARPLR